MSKGNKIAEIPSEALKTLWREGFFRSWRTFRVVSEKLSGRGNNFGPPQLSDALRHASHLTRRGKRGAFEYAQKKPASADNAVRKSAGAFFVNYDLHKRIKEVVGQKYENGHYAEAVEAAFKEVIKRVKDYVKSKIGGTLDGARAIGRAFDFNGQEPLIKFNNLQSDEEKDEQRGIALLFKGVVFIRNRKAHENITLSDPKRALEYLALASLLMRLLDENAK